MTTSREVPWLRPLAISAAIIAAPLLLSWPWWGHQIVLLLALPAGVILAETYWSLRKAQETRNQGVLE